MTMDNVIIRKYREEDRPKVREICYESVFLGEPVEAFFDDKEILADIMTLYYTDHEPGSMFVAEDSGRIVGYLAGCPDSRKCREIGRTSIIPGVLRKVLIRGIIFKPKTAKLLFHSCIGLIKGEFNVPYMEDYPAYFRVYIAKNYRKMGIGSRLLDAYLEHLREKQIKGVYSITVSEEEKMFLLNRDFKILSSRTSRQLYRVVGKDFAVSAMVKKTDN